MHVLSKFCEEKQVTGVDSDKGLSNYANLNIMLLDLDPSEVK